MADGRTPRSLSDPHDIYGAERSWRNIPSGYFERARSLRRDLTPAERKLWGYLRAEQLGTKFRKQHPIGPYIADFFCGKKAWSSNVTVTAILAMKAWGMIRSVTSI